jgi:hypothetical protein
MKVEGGLFGKKETSGKKEGEERVTMDKYDQSTL